MRYMRYVGLKNTLLPHLRQRQRSSIHQCILRENLSQSESTMRLYRYYRGTQTSG